MKAKSGWGFTGVDTKIDLTQKTEKRTQAIWEQTEVAVITVPELEVLPEARGSVSLPPSLVTGKVEDYTKLVLDARRTTLPLPEEGVDLDDLMGMMRSNEEVQEPDEVWEFGRLKNEAYETVSRLYGRS